MVDYIRRFELPNENWYDEKGRIYKDILITNFNAIEDKLNELSELNALDITVPSWNDIHIDDCDVYNAPDNQVVNLKTLVETLHLVNFPIVVDFTGTTCNKIQYSKSTNTLSKLSKAVSLIVFKDLKAAVNLAPQAKLLELKKSNDISYLSFTPFLPQS